MEYAYNSPIQVEDKENAQDSMLRVNSELSRISGNGEQTSLVVWVGDTHLHKRCYDADEKGVHGYTGLPHQYRELVSTERQIMLAFYEIGLLRPKPNLLLLGGDMIEYGFKGEYELLFELLDSVRDIPHYYIVGNHEHGLGDLPVEFIEVYESHKRQYWPEIPCEEALYYSIVHQNTKYIFIDRKVDSYGATLDQKQYNWLKEELGNSALPTIICSHRSLLPVGNWIDDKFPDLALWSLLDSSPQVMAVLSGHNHTPNLWRYRNKLYVVFPSTAYSIGGVTGWGGMLLINGQIETIFVKELYGPSFNSIYPNRLEHQKGELHLMKANNFEESPLYNPEYWPRSEQELK